MKKYLWVMAMAGAAAVLSLAGCGKSAQSDGTVASSAGSQSADSKSESQAKSGGQAIRIVNGKIEIDEPLKRHLPKSIRRRPVRRL
ncbi:MAG: hypothetical protein K0R23_500 [Lacrimispora sp.]|nr:hypothetical protein [Lacrimispora sp.]